MKSLHIAPNTAKTLRSGEFRWFALGIGLLLAAVTLIASFPSRPEDSSVTLSTTVIDQASLDGPAWTPRPKAPSVVPEDVSKMDPASQGILNYVRVHDAIPDYVILDQFKSQFNPPD